MGTTSDVQHIARGFIPALADWLNNTISLAVRIAQQGERLLPGQIYLAPPDHHLVVPAPGVAGLRPSADVLFESVARSYSARAIGLVLTGMGDDGVRGLLALRTAGAPMLAQCAADGHRGRHLRAAGQYHARSGDVVTAINTELSDELYASFRDLLLARCGLHYPERKRSDLAHGLGMVLDGSS